MKIIGIIGNIGKTYTCELLYQYLLNCNKATMVCCSNGVFKNGTTIWKDSELAKIYDKEFEKIDFSGLDYLIIELCEELQYGNFKTKQFHFDCICNTTINDRLIQAHTVEENFYYGLINQLISDKYYCLNTDLDKLSLYTDKIFNTYGLVDYSISLTNSTFIYNNNTFNCNMIADFEFKNISAFIQVLEYVNEYDSNVLQTTLDNILIRGRLNIYNYGDKTIILDTGWYGINSILDNLSNNNLLDLSDVDIILVPYKFDNLHMDAMKLSWRRNVGQYFIDNDMQVFLTGCPDFRVDEFKKIYNYNDFYYYEDLVEALHQAISTSTKNNIFIMGNYRFREFRELLVENKNRQE